MAYILAAYSHFLQTYFFLLALVKKKKKNSLVLLCSKMQERTLSLNILLLTFTVIKV